MRTASGLLAAILLGTPALAQQVADCEGAPPVTDLVEPWEETSASLGEGAIRLALLHPDEAEGVSLLALTLPPPQPPAEGDVPASEIPPEEAEASPVERDAEPGAPEPEGVAAEAAPLPPQPRRCRVVTEGGLGFADLDLAGIEVTEDPEAATLTARIPALGFIPESTELEELTLLLTFGVADESLEAAIERPAP